MAPAFVQKNDSSIANGASGSLAYGSPNTAGNLLVAVIGWNSNVILTITDTQGNVWQPITGINNGTLNGQLWYALNAKGGANTVNLNFSSATTAIWAFIGEWSGVNGLDNFCIQNNSGGNNFLGTGTVIPNSNGVWGAATHDSTELVIGFASLSGSTTSTPAASYNLRSQATAQVHV